ncbi:MAG TPA: DUF488 family protein [Deltaproteobacteria bacterium]|nr:DUF488 family protein [Deltaproteobacteria bacterium]
MDVEIRVKRIYDEAAADDGLRVLVERLWPRGMSKERAAVHLWLREIAPSVQLRRWFGHDPSRWTEFRRRYRRELDAREEAVELILERCGRSAVTLLYSARDRERNSAVVLGEYLAERKSRRAGARPERSPIEAQAHKRKP